MKLQLSKVVCVSVRKLRSRMSSVFCDVL